ncbi:MAG: hypothetical protein ACLFP4_07535 [Spirochaetales bacterium]
MRGMRVAAIVLVVLLLFASCVPGPNPLEDSPNEEGELYGFWFGLWHGFIAPFTFVISLFTDDVSPYAVTNNGGWYNFGFILGAMAIFGGGGGGAAHGRRRR